MALLKGRYPPRSYIVKEAANANFLVICRALGDQDITCPLFGSSSDPTLDFLLCPRRRTANLPQSDLSGILLL
jgi:hypothetical protein